MAQVTKNPYTWVTGRNVNTHKNLNEMRGLPQAPAQEDAELEEPNQSADKPTWLAYRKAQGYTDEQLDGLNKDKVLELPDDPSEFEPEE